MQAAGSTLKTVLSIAGFDPSSGAGVTADLMVFAAHGLFGISAITALTAQSTQEVRASHAVEATFLRDTLECLGWDFSVAGVKIGMIASSDNVRVISKYIAELKNMDEGMPVVLDPVLASSSGRELLDVEGIFALRKDLLPLVDWVTPNSNELQVLTGIRVASGQELLKGGQELGAQVGVRADGRRIGVLAKGGHLDQPDDLLLTPEGEEHWLKGERIETTATHGTGCALSSAFLSRLVLGDKPVHAARWAKDYVAGAMRQAPGIGRGKGPMGLLWPLRADQSG